MQFISDPPTPDERGEPLPVGLVDDRPEHGWEDLPPREQLERCKHHSRVQGNVSAKIFRHTLTTQIDEAQMSCNITRMIKVASGMIKQIISSKIAKKSDETRLFDPD